MAQIPKNQKSTLGIAALQRNLISQKQLMECLNLQRASGTDVSLERILVQKGYLTRQQVQELAKTGVGTTKTRDLEKKKVVTRSKQAGTAPRPQMERTGTAVPKSRVRKQPTGVFPEKGETKRPTRKRVHRATEIRPAVGTTKTKKGRTRVTAKKQGKWEEVSQTDPGKNRAIMLGGLFAGIPVFLLLGYLILKPGGEPPTPQNTETVLNNPTPVIPTQKEPPTEPVDEDLPEPVIDTETAKSIRLTQIPDNSDLARRWNQIVDSLGRTPKPVDTARTISSVTNLVAESKGTPYESHITNSYRDMVRQVHAYAEEMFEFIAEQADSLAKAGKYADAVNAWDWFPAIVDPNEIFQDRISATKSQTRESGYSFYATLKSKSKALVDSGKIEEARRLMMTALEIGFSQVTDEAYGEISKLLILN